MKLVEILNQLLNYNTAIEKVATFQGNNEKLEQKKQFEKILKEEVIDKVYLTNYKLMKGQCDECTIFDGIFES